MTRIVDYVVRDVRFGIRVLLSTPLFTGAALLVLALGIGANTAIFSIVNALLLRSIQYKESDRLVLLWNRSPGLGIAQDWLSPAQYVDIKTQTDVFDDAAIVIGGSFNLTGVDTPARIEGIRVSSSLFSFHVSIATLAYGVCLMSFGRTAEASLWFPY